MVGTTDGRLLQGSIRGIERALTTRHRGAITALAWGHTWIASGSAYHVVKLWQPDNEEAVITFTELRDSVYGLAWGPYGLYIASRDEPSKLWDAQSAREGVVFRLDVDTMSFVSQTVHAHALTGIHWSHNRLFTTSLDGHARVWDADLQLLVDLPHRDAVWGCDELPNGTIVTITSRLALHRWGRDGTKQNGILHFEAPPLHISIWQDQVRVALRNGELCFFNWDTGMIIERFQFSAPVTCVAQAAQGAIALGTADGGIWAIPVL
jgi:WD40 repeat protein